MREIKTHFDSKNLFHCCYADVNGPIESRRVVTNIESSDESRHVHTRRDVIWLVYYADVKTC